MRRKALASSVFLIAFLVTAFGAGFFVGGGILVIGPAFLVAAAWQLINVSKFRCQVCRKSLYERRFFFQSMWPARKCAFCKADISEQ